MSTIENDEYNIVSQDLEDHLQISKERALLIERELQNSQHSSIPLPSLELIESLIENGDRGVAKASVIDAISPSNEYLLGIERLKHTYEVERQHLLFIELLREGEVSLENLIGYLDRIAREYYSLKDKKPVFIESAITKLFEEIGTEKEDYIIEALLSTTMKYYSKDPVKVRDICLSFYRGVAKFNSHISKSYFVKLKKNMFDDRVCKLVIRDSRKCGELVLAYECASILRDSEWGLYVMRELIPEICDSLSNCLSEVDDTILRYSNFEKRQNGWALEFLYLISNHSLEISNFVEDSVDGGKLLDDADILSSFIEWHRALTPGTELVGDGKWDFGEFGEDLSKIPLYQLPLLISRRFSELDSQDFSDEIQRTIGKITDSDPRRAKEVMFHATEALLHKDPQHVISLFYGIGDHVSDERISRRIAMAHEALGEYDEAIRNCANSDNPRTKNLHESIVLRKKWLEEGYDLEYFEKNETYSPISGKILYSSHSCLPFVTSGYSIRTHYIVKELGKKGIDISVAARWGFPSDRVDFDDFDKMTDRVELDGVEYNFDPDNGGMLEFKMEEYVNKCAESLMKTAMKNKPSVIHSASDHTIGIASSMVCKSLQIPFIYEMRGLWALSRVANNPRFRNDPRFRIMLSLERKCAESADIVITLSNAMRDMIAEWGIERQKIVVVPNGVSTEEMVPVERDVEISEKFGLRGKTCFGYIGSIVPYEGLEILVRAVVLLPKKKRESMRFIVIGEGTDRSRIESLAIDSGVSDCFVFTGRVDHSDISKYYSIIDSVILPRTSEEVCEIVPALKPLEAMSMEKPIICSDISPSVELIRGNFNGLLFSKDNPKSLAEVITEVAENLDKFQKLGKASRQWVKKNRNWKKLTERIGDIYLFLKIRGLAEQRLLVGEIARNVEEFIRTEMSRETEEVHLEEIIERLVFLTEITEQNEENRTSRNVFLGILRGIGLHNSRVAIEYGEKFISTLGDHRSIKSMTTFYKRMGVSEDEQISLLGASGKGLPEDFEDIIARENRKIRLRESPFYVEFEVGNLTREIEGAATLSISGNVLVSGIEPPSAALIQMEFLGVDGARIEEAPGLLSNSKRVGWYSYLHQEIAEGGFSVEFQPPPGTERILAGLRTWNNEGDVYLLPDLSIERTSLDVTRKDLKLFAEYAKNCDSETVVFMFSGTTFVQGVRANRPIRLTTDLMERGIPVIFNYHRWNRREEIPEARGNLIQIPIDITERILGEIAELDFGSKRKLFVVSYPHPSISKILNRFRVLGWSTIYDARDEWEEFHKVGQANWFKTWNEKYIVSNVDHVTSVSWPLAEKLDRFSPRNPVEVLPNALSPHFLSEDYESKRSGKGKIGYFGHLTSSWFDWESLIEIAKKLSNFKFEIIGHSEPDDLVLPENVSLLGPKTHPEINDLAAHWDVAIIPFRIGKLSDAVDPIKIYEYLALGLPTVSFRMPQIDNYPYTRTVDSVQEFCDSLDFFVREKVSIDEIEDWLGSNTWGDRVNRMLELSKIYSDDGIISIGE